MFGSQELAFKAASADARRSSPASPSCARLVVRRRVAAFDEESSGANCQRCLLETSTNSSARIGRSRIPTRNAMARARKPISNKRSSSVPMAASARVSVARRRASARANRTRSAKTSIRAIHFTWSRASSMAWDRYASATSIVRSGDRLVRVDLAGVEAARDEERAVVGRRCRHRRVRGELDLVTRRGDRRRGRRRRFAVPGPFARQRRGTAIDRQHRLPCHHPEDAHTDPRCREGVRRRAWPCRAPALARWSDHRTREGAGQVLPAGS